MLRCRQTRTTTTCSRRTRRASGSRRSARRSRTCAPSPSLVPCTADGARRHAVPRHATLCHSETTMPWPRPGGRCASHSAERVAFLSWQVLRGACVRRAAARPPAARVPMAARPRARHRVAAGAALLLARDARCGLARDSKQPVSHRCIAHGTSAGTQAFALPPFALDGWGLGGSPAYDVDVAVVGGGAAGIAAAAALSRAGLRVTLLEAPDHHAAADELTAWH